MQCRMITQAERAVVRAPRILLLASLLALCACADGASRPMSEPTPPPGATLPYPSNGPLMTAALFTFADLRSRLQAHYRPPWESHRYAVSAATDWPALIEHYTRELGPNWHVDNRYAENAGINYRLKVWSDGRHVVAIALNEPQKPGAEHALTVMFTDVER